MKTLTTQAELARQRRWQEVYYLLELTLYRDKFSIAPVSLLLRLSDRSRQALAEEWLPLVVDWGNVGDELAQIDPSGNVGTLDVTLRNDVRVGGAARFTDLLRHGRNTSGYDQAFGEATLYQVFAGAAAGDQTRLFALITEEVTDITAETCVLRMSGRELASEDRDNLLRVTTDRFPFASPTAIGQKIPLAFGVLKQMPVLWAVAGLVDKLRVAMTPSNPSDGGRVYVSSPEILSRFPSAGRIQIDSEQIQYSGKDTAAVAFSGCTFAVNTTTRGAHAIGAPVVQVLSKFIAIAWENRGDYHGSSVDAVYFLDGTLKDPTAVPRHVIKLHDVDLWPGKDLCTVHFEGVDQVS